MTKQPEEHKKDVIDYYNSTKREYRILWKNDKNLGIHFGYYDSKHQDHNSAVININRKLAEVAGITKNDKVLDAGCGVGGTSFWLAENIKCQATGITIVPWHAEKARELNKHKGLEHRVQFIQGDFADTGLKDGSHTVFLGLESIVHAIDKLAVVREAYRLLKPGGRLVICEYMLESDDMSKDDSALIQQWLDGWSMPSLLTEDEYRVLAKKAKFKKSVFHDWTEPALPSFNRLNKFIKILMPIHKPLRLLRIVNDGQINNLTASHAQMITLSRGLWRFKVMVATK